MSSVLEDFGDLCAQTVIWEPLVSRDAYGKPSYGPAQTFKGRRVYRLSRVPQGAGLGTDAVSQSQIWIMGLPTLKYEDRLYIEGDDVTKVPSIVGVSRYPDENGDYYVSASMGAMA